MQATKSDFLAAYERELFLRYEWTKDEPKMLRFMASVKATLTGANTWAHDGEAVVLAWRAIGGKGKPTLKALRALPA